MLTEMISAFILIRNKPSRMEHLYSTHHDRIKMSITQHQKYWLLSLFVVLYRRSWQDETRPRGQRQLRPPPLNQQQWRSRWRLSPQTCTRPNSLGRLRSQGLGAAAKMENDKTHAPYTFLSLQTHVFQDFWLRGNSLFFLYLRKNHFVEKISRYLCIWIQYTFNVMIRWQIKKKNASICLLHFTVIC